MTSTKQKNKADDLDLPPEDKILGYLVPVDSEEDLMLAELTHDQIQSVLDNSSGRPKKQLLRQVRRLARLRRVDEATSTRRGKTAWGIGVGSGIAFCAAGLGAAATVGLTPFVAVLVGSGIISIFVGVSVGSSHSEISSRHASEASEYEDIVEEHS